MHVKKTAATALTLGVLSTSAAVITPAAAHAATMSTTYTVRSGDTLSRIASSHKTTVKAIMSLNKLTDPNRLKVGQRLRVPVSSPAARSPYAPGTNVHYSQSQQVMVADRVSGTKGTWARYEWRGAAAGWVKVSADATSVFGTGGVKPAGQRVQGDHSTPAGNFVIKYTFGERNPGTRMGYKTITNRSVWVNNQRAYDYNRWRENSTLSGSGIGEDLSYYRDRGLYRQAAVIGYNYDKPIRYGRGSGAGIFLHYARNYTEGCVGLNNMSELTNTIKWLNPAKRPVITIKS